MTIKIYRMEHELVVLLQRQQVFHQTTVVPYFAAAANWVFSIFHFSRGQVLHYQTRNQLSFVLNFEFIISYKIKISYNIPKYWGFAW